VRSLEINYFSACVNAFICDSRLANLRIFENIYVSKIVNALNGTSEIYQMAFIALFSVFERGQQQKVWVLTL
jgi:hypothetical protein